MSKKEQGTEELAKLSKLLDKIENEIKKKREDSIYVQSEKFLEHMKKTTDVYSLVIDEVIGSLYVMGYTEHTNVLKKLFRGVQQQINSVLKFSLKYYARKSSEIEGSHSKKKESVSEEVEVLIDKRTLLPYCAVTTRGQTTKQFHSTAAAPRENNFSPSKSHSPSRSSSNHFFQPPAQAPYSLFKNGNGMATPPHRRDFSMGNALNRSEYTYNYDDPDQQEADLQAYKNESDQMQRDIDDLLEGRKNMENYAQNDISTNLKQVLKGLEGFKKKVKALGEGEDGEEMDENHMDFHSLTGSMMGAFEKAQKKTAKKVFGYALTKAVDSTQTNDVGTMPDPELLEAEKKFYRRDLEMMLNQKLEEITFAKKKIGLIEQDRNTLHDKYTKVSLEHAKCEQSQKEMQIRMISTEKEHDHIKSIMEEVKRGKVDRLFLSKDQEDALKKNIQSMNSPEDLTQMLMAKLKESKREAKVLKYQLEHGGQRPPSGFFDDNDDDIPSLTSFNKPAAGKANNNSTAKKKGGVQGSISKNNNNRGAVDDDDDSAGPIEAVEVEEEVMIDGKLVKVKKTVYRQLKKKIITNENGEKVEVEEYEDVDESQVQMGKDGTLVKINPGVKVTADGKKMVKVVTKDKNGKETVQWVEVPADADVEGGDSSKPVIIQSADGKILKKVVKKDKNGKEVVEWVEVPVDTEDAAKTGTIKTADGKVLKKVVKKDKNGKEVVEWVEAVEGEDGTVQTADGKVLKKVVKKDKNGKEVVEWVEDTSKKGKGAKKDGIMTLQEEVEEEVTVLDENGNAIKVKRKVMKTKQVKKFVDENGEEVIEEEVIDPLTGEKKTVRRKVKDLKNAKLLVDNHSDSGDSMYSAHGTKRKVKHKEIQTKFAVEDLIKSALESAGIKGEALNDINKMLAKHGVDIFNPKKVDDGDEVVMIPGNKKKIIYNKGEDVEEIEYVTKDGRVIKKKVPKGEKDDYEIDENGELKPKKKKGKHGRFGSNDTDEDDKLNESMISVLSMDANGNVVKKKKLKKFVPYEQGGTKKATLDDMIRQQELLEKAGPPLTKEEQQDRAMYKAMLMKAKQDPKLMGLFKKFMKEKGIEVGEGDDFIVDFDTFKDYIKDLKDKHKRCGDGCVHLQRFYARIGFYPNWNNRVPLEMKRPDIASEKARPTKLPYITPKRLASPK